MSIKRQVAILEQQLQDTLKGIEDLKNHNGERFSIKALMKTQKSIEKKLANLNSTSRKDDVLLLKNWVLIDYLLMKHIIIKTYIFILK